jgi:hypothetical protein
MAKDVEHIFRILTGSGREFLGGLAGFRGQAFR